MLGSAVLKLFEMFLFRMAPNSHIIPLRRFLENVIEKDLRNFFAQSCFKVGLWLLCISVLVCDV
jgi:hypothetical protein